MGKSYHVIFLVFPGTYLQISKYSSLTKKKKKERKKLTLKKVSLCQVTLVHRCLVASL